MPPEQTPPTPNESQLDDTFTTNMLLGMCVDVFEQWSNSRDTMSGKRFKACCKSILPTADLATIWDMSDLDGNGVFSLDEFATALLLIICKKCSGSPIHFASFEIIRNNKELNPPLLARYKKFFTLETELICSNCNGDVRVGSWVCKGCANCAERGAKPQDISYLICISCWLKNADTLASEQHCLVWAKHVMVEKLASDLGMVTCGSCGSYQQGRQPYACRQCDFDCCQSCYKTGFMCPWGHQLEYLDSIDNAGTVDISSLSFNEIKTSNPFLTSEDEDEDVDEDEGKVNTNPLQNSASTEKKNET